MLYNKQVPIAESALLVIDVQDSFKIDPKWERRNTLNFEKNVARLIKAYREANLPIVYFLHNDDDPGFEIGNPHVKLMDFLSPRANEPLLWKQTRNAFTSTLLQTILLEKNARKVVITGIQMEQCCETTARVAADIGYAVDFVMDATLTFPIAHREKPGEELGVKEIEERTAYALRGRFARIATTDQIVKECEASCAKLAEFATQTA